MRMTEAPPGAATTRTSSSGSILDSAIRTRIHAWPHRVACWWPKTVLSQVRRDETTKRFPGGWYRPGRGLPSWIELDWRAAGQAAQPSLNRRLKALKGATG